MKNRYIQIFSCLIALLSFATFPACELDDEINFVKGNTISVTTNPISDIGSTYAVAGGVVKATSNNTVITERGVVYSTSPNPTIESDIKVSGGSGLGSFGCDLVDLLEETKYYVRAYAINGYGKVLYGEEKSFTTNRAMYENGHEYIDLGLSVKWATMNVGASKAEDYGGYYAWGETEPQVTNYWWSTYKWCNGSYSALTKYCHNSSYGNNGFTDNKTQLDLSDDAAHVNWGGDWRMPTDAEWTELREQCTWTWTWQNGVKGYKVRSKNGNFIFLPAAGYRDGSSLDNAGSDGYYWSSSLHTDYPDWARGVHLNLSNVLYYYDRYRGQSVRPVLGENESVQTTAPAVTTAVVTQITETSAVAGGNVTSDGNASVTERGVVYSTNPNPVITNLNNTIRPCGSGTGEFTYTITGLQAGTKYYIRAYAKNDVGTAYGEEMSFTTKVQATPEYVDLGLSVKWATFNVGASTPEEYGDHFAWGETVSKVTYSWGSYKWCYGSKTTLTKYNTDSSYGTVDNKTQLYLSDDAAHVNWGGDWRMPTDAEWTELREQCTWTWTTQNGVNGYKVTSKKVSYSKNSIFLPAAGYHDGSSLGKEGFYWSSSLYTDYPSYAWNMHFNSSNVRRYYYNRYYGFTVRPVFGEKTPPAVTTSAVTQITETSAVAGGNVTSDGGASVTERGVCIATVSNPTTANTKISAGSGTGTFNCNLTNLQPNTKYYVRAYAINTKGTAYGNEVTFTTNKTVVLPTVTTSTITQITETSAVAGGNVTSDGNANVTERGVCISTVFTPTTSNTKVKSGTGTGSFTCNLTGLQPNTRYYVRAYAINSKGTAYGTQVTFTTSKTVVLPTVTTSTITQITETSAVAGGNVTSDGNANVTERGVCISTVSNPTTSNTKVKSGTGTGSFTCNLTGLQPNTKYYVRAYAINSKGTAYGTQVTFTTQELSSSGNGTDGTHEYVDLGLSVKWATMNVGATKPEEYGDYFAWGETEPKETYNWSTYKWCNGSLLSTLTKYNTSSSYGTVDNKTTLELNDDAARANWGGSWRMPTDAEMTELRTNCTWTWTTENGVNGYKVTSKSNGNSIFLPAAGERYNRDLGEAGSRGIYRSSSLDSAYPERAWYVDFTSSYVNRNDFYRYFGLSVRAVHQ